MSEYYVDLVQDSFINISQSAIGITTTSYIKEHVVIPTTIKFMIMELRVQTQSHHDEHCDL